MSFAKRRHTAETKEKIRRKITGRTHSEKSIEKMRIVRTGMKMSPEFSAILSARTKGEKHWNWKGGVTSLRLRIRNNMKSRQWRLSIFERDNFTCVLCGKWGGTLNADHYPIPFAVLIYQHDIKTLEEALSCKKLWDIGNGRTLCKPCHDKNKPANPRPEEVKKLILK